MAGFAELKFKSKAALGMIKDIDEQMDGVIDRDRQYVQLVGAIAFGDVMDHYAKGEGPDGKWKPWSAAYTSHMNSIKKGGNNVLMDTGRMRNTTLFPFQGSGAAKDAILINPAKTKAKKPFPYAFAHNEGGSQLPKREFMWLSDKGMQKVADQTLKFLLK